MHFLTFGSKTGAFPNAMLLLLFAFCFNTKASPVSSMKVEDETNSFENDHIVSHLSSVEHITETIRDQLLKGMGLNDPPDTLHVSHLRKYAVIYISYSKC